MLLGSKKLQEVEKDETSLSSSLKLSALVALCMFGSTMLGMHSSVWIDGFGFSIAIFSPLNTLAGIALIVSAPKWGTLAQHSWLMPTCLAGVLLGVLLSTLIPGLLFVGLTLAVLSAFMIEMRLFEALITLSAMRLRQVVVCSSIVGMAFGYMVSFEASVALFAGASAYAIVAAVLLTLPQTHSNLKSNNLKRVLTLQPKTMLGIIIVAFAAHLASGKAALSLDSTLLITILAFFAAFALLWLCAIWRDDPGHFNLVCCLVVSSVLVYVVKLTIVDASGLLSLLSIMLGALVWIGVIVSALDLCTYAATSSLRIMGGAYVLLTFPSFATSVADIASRTGVSLFSSDILYGVMIVLLVVSGMLLLNESALDRLFWGNLQKAEHGGDNDEAIVDNTASEDADGQEKNGQTDRLSALADKAGLSRREQEVLYLLAGGRSAPYIAERLYIEKSTVKSHIAHIYTKLGVHTRQDLLSFINNDGA